MKNMYTLGVIGLLAYAATVAVDLAIAASVVSPVGTYACHGVNPDQTTYDLTLAVEAEGESYKLTWLSNGQPQMIGLGLRDGDALSVAFFGQQIVGIVIYRVSSGRLVGTWTAGDGQRGTETCSVGLAA